MTNLHQQSWLCAVVEGRKERSLRWLDGDQPEDVGCNYCLAFQRVSDYALPR
jgi:hypothetical protein